MKQETINLDATFKAKLYILLSIAVLFIAIIPARIISGIFSQDTSIFCISFAGFVVLLEFLAWCFLCAPMEVYESLSAKKIMSEELPVAEEHAETEMTVSKIVSEKPEMPLAIKEETKNDIVSSSMVDLYRQGCDDFYRNQAAHRKEQLDKIMEYLHYAMAPFVKQDDMETFCGEIMSFAIDPTYEPKPFVGLKGTLTIAWNCALGSSAPCSQTFAKTLTIPL